MTDSTGTPYQQSPTDPTPYRRLRRSRSDRMLGGVCAGFAEYLKVDPTLVRIGVVVLGLITWGVAAIGYLIAWLIMPESDPAS